MLDTVGNSENFEAWYSNGGQAATGLTVTVNVRDPSGTLVVTGASATEVGDGYYTYSLSSSLTTTPGIYRALFMTSGTVDQKHQPSEWIVGKPWVASHPSAAPNAAGGVLTVGTGAGQINPNGSGKVPATLAAGDVADNALTAAALAADAAAEITAAVAAQVISDHGTGSYVRNTEHPTVVQVRQEIDANSTKTGYALSASGLDAVTAAEPTGPTSGYNFRQLLRWLVMRFENVARTPTGLTVKTRAGATATTQAVSDDGAGNESTSATS